MTIRLRPATLGALLLSAGCARTTPPAVRPATAPDPAPYRRACGACHGVDARGDGPVAASLKTPPPDLTRLAARAGGTFPRERVWAIVTGEEDVAIHGTREMPVWSERFAPSNQPAAGVAAAVARQRLEAIVDWLASVQVPARAEPQEKPKSPRVR